MNAPLPPNALAIPTIPIMDIVPSPTNPRKHFSVEGLDELAASIRAEGVIQPITVRDNPKGSTPYEIVFGERRWRAAKLAGLTDIPAYWRALDDQAVLEIQCIENLQREDLHPLEEAEGYEALIAMTKCKAEDIAGKIGKSRSYVYSRLQLLKLGDKIRKRFYDGTLDATTALLISRIPGDKLQQKALERINQNEMSFRSAKAYIERAFMLDLTAATWSLTDATLLPEAGACSTCPKCTAGNPELMADIKRPNVCTDTQCADNKRLARHSQLLQQAEQRKIPIIRGDDAEEHTSHNGFVDSADFIDLDENIDGDAKGRTYRDVLGDKAPVSAVIEHKTYTGTLLATEVATPTVLEAALKKAGFKPEAAPVNKEAVADAKLRKEREAKAQAEQEARDRAVEAESHRRDALVAALFPALQARLAPLLDAADPTIGGLFRSLTRAYLKYDTYFTEELPEAPLERWGYVVPEAYDLPDELANISDALSARPAIDALTLLVDVFTNHERRVNAYRLDNPEERPSNLREFAQLVGVNLTKTPPDPTPATRVQEQGAPGEAPRPDVRYALWTPSGWQTWAGKGKRPTWITDWLANGKTLADLEATAKADPDPAPASPANEPSPTPGAKKAPPAATVKTKQAADAWPWPSGNPAEAGKAVAS